MSTPLLLYISSSPRPDIHLASCMHVKNICHHRVFYSAPCPTAFPFFHFPFPPQNELLLFLSPLPLCSFAHLPCRNQSVLGGFSPRLARYLGVSQIFDARSSILPISLTPVEAQRTHSLPPQSRPLTPDNPVPVQALSYIYIINSAAPENRVLDCTSLCWRY